MNVPGRTFWRGSLSRYLRLFLTAAVLTPAVGCNWIRNWGQDSNKSTGTGQLPQVGAEQLVSYLNERANRLQSISYGAAELRCFERGMPMPALDGNLACSQPRNFRMVGKGRMVSAKIDFGSNPEQFWVFVQVPSEKPIYVFASHSDFEAGRAKLPGGVPFEPDWVMQALGMTTFPPGNAYKAELLDKDRVYVLSWPATTPNGMQIRKEIVFDGDAATGSRPQVKRHVVRDAKGKVICSAEVRTAQTVQVGTVSGSSLPAAVQFPTRVVLRWEEQKFEMDLTLKDGQINQTISPEQSQRLFTRPTIPNVNPINLAEYQFK